MALGPRLRRYRRAKRLTQRELAQRAEVRQAYISELETGLRRNPHVETLQRLARVLGISLSMLIGEEPRQEQRRSPHPRVVWETVRG